MNQRTRRRERVEVSGEEKYAEHCIRKREGGGGGEGGDWGVKETAKRGDGRASGRKREIGERKKEEKERRKKKRIRGFSRRRVEWLGGRIIELPLIPSSPLCWVKRGKKPVEKAARVRPKLSLSFYLVKMEGRKKEDIYRIEGRKDKRKEREKGKNRRSRGSWLKGCGLGEGGREGGQNRRDDNICIIFNARTSRLRGGRHSLLPPSSPPSSFLHGLFSSSPPPPSYPRFLDLLVLLLPLYFISLLHRTRPPSSILERPPPAE